MRTYTTYVVYLDDDFCHSMSRSIQSITQMANSFSCAVLFCYLIMSCAFHSPFFPFIIYKWFFLIWCSWAHRFSMQTHIFPCARIIQFGWNRKCSLLWALMNIMVYIMWHYVRLERLKTHSHCIIQTMPDEIDSSFFDAE